MNFLKLLFAILFLLVSFNAETKIEIRQSYSVNFVISNTCNTLRQEELAKCGEDVGQRAARFIPVVGTLIDHHYDRISDSEFYGTLGIDVALLAASTFGKLANGAKEVKEIRNAAKAKLVENLEKNIAEIREAQRKVGNVKTYGELTSKAPKGGFVDGKEVHHILPVQTLEKLGLNPRKAPAVVVTCKQHSETISFRGKKYGPFSSLQEEIDANIDNIIDIFKRDGTYTKDIENNLRNVVNEFIKKNNI